MTKADYIHLFKEACGGRCNAEYNPCAFRQAADSLTALEPVGEIRSVVWNGMAWTVSFISHKHLNLRTKLYALDEANNENAPLP
jgi:hypothetical protein